MAALEPSTGPTSCRRRPRPPCGRGLILAALTLGRIAFGYQFQTVATLGPTLVPLFHLTYAEFGALIGAYMLLGAFVALPLGVLGRWLGDRMVTGVGLALMVAGPCVSAWGGDPASIAAGRIIAGVGGVGMLVPQGKIIADWFTGPRLMLAMSIVVCGYPIGVGLAQLVLPPVSHAFGWPAGFLIGASLSRRAALVLFLASFRPSPHVAARAGAFLAAEPARVPAGGHRRHDLHRLYRGLRRVFLLCAVHPGAARRRTWR